MLKRTISPVSSITREAVEALRPSGSSSVRSKASWGATVIVASGITPRSIAQCRLGFRMREWNALSAKESPCSTTMVSPWASPSIGVPANDW